MQITMLDIEGTGGNIRILRTEDGANVYTGNHFLFSIGRQEQRDARFAKAAAAAKALYGSDRHGKPAATDSMIHEVCNEIDRVAGC